MKKPVEAEKLNSVSIHLGNEVGKIERLPINESGQEQIRFSIWSQGKMLEHPLSLTEEELIALLQTAIHEGILSRDFIRRLHLIIEI
jgi:hypothetical protein